MITPKNYPFRFTDYAKDASLPKPVTPIRSTAPSTQVGVVGIAQDRSITSLLSDSEAPKPCNHCTVFIDADFAIYGLLPVSVVLTFQDYQGSGIDQGFGGTFRSPGAAALSWAGILDQDMLYVKTVTVSCGPYGKMKVRVPGVTKMETGLYVPHLGGTYGVIIVITVTYDANGCVVIRFGLTFELP